MSERVVYLNGELIPADRAGVSVFDTGLLHGASVFTTMLARNGKVFRLARHLQRLMANADAIDLRHAATVEELTEAVDKLLTANGLADARVRITLTPGPVGVGGRATTLVTAAEPGIDPQWYQKGIGAITSAIRQYEHSPLAGVKTGCYLLRVLARQAAAAVGADEALWFTLSGHLAEGCYTNVFLVRGGEVHTPPLDTPVLGGIVREAVLEICDTLEIPRHDEIPLTADDVAAADEMFVTSSVAGVRPVVRLDRRGIGDEKPGPVTRKILAAYADLLEAECPAPKP